MSANLSLCWEGKTVHLFYIHTNGSHFMDVQYKTNLRNLCDIVEEVKSMRNKKCLPKLLGMNWDGYIYIIPDLKYLDTQLIMPENSP